MHNPSTAAASRRGCSIADCPTRNTSSINETSVTRHRDIRTATAPTGSRPAYGHGGHSSNSCSNHGDNATSNPTATCHDGSAASVIAASTDGTAATNGATLMADHGALWCDSLRAPTSNAHRQYVVRSTAAADVHTNRR